MEVHYAKEKSHILTNLRVHVLRLPIDHFEYSQK